MQKTNRLHCKKQIGVVSVNTGRRQAGGKNPRRGYPKSSTSSLHLTNPEPTQYDLEGGNSTKMYSLELTSSPEGTVGSKFVEDLVCFRFCENDSVGGFIQQNIRGEFLRCSIGSWSCQPCSEPRCQNAFLRACPSIDRQGLG